MKLIHTGDWHLGKLLENESRLEEQALFLQDFIDLCEANEVDVILIAGDVYDGPNPPARAESLFYETIKRLSNKGERLVVVLSGNHDNPHRLGAAAPLAKEHGILLATSIGESTFEKQYGKFTVLETCSGGIQLKVGNEILSLALLPYPSESRLNQVLSEKLEEGAMQMQYSEAVKQLLQTAAGVFTDTSLNIVLSHVFVGGSETSDSERPIQVGGGYTVFREAFPKNADYIALGHLHRPQSTTLKMEAIDIPLRYAGSPLQYSRSEMGYAKSVTLLTSQRASCHEQVEGQLAMFDAMHDSDGTKLHIEEIPLYNHKPIVVWRVQGVEAALEKLRQEAERPSWAYLEIQMDRVIMQDEIKAMKAIKPDLLAIVPILPEMQSEALLNGDVEPTLDLAQLFRSFHLQELGVEAEEDVLNLFLEIVSKEEVDETDSTDSSGY